MKRKTWQELLNADCSSVPPGFFQRNQDTQRCYDLYKQTDTARDFRMNIFRNSQHLLSLNKFPYELDEGIRHWTFWMKPGFEQPKESVKRVFGVRFVVIENVPEAKSIPDIPHYHLFENLHSGKM